MLEVRAEVLRRAVIAICMTLAAGPAFGDAREGATANSGVDASIRPADDFYGYANAMWLKSTRLPAGATSLDTSAMLRAENARRVRLLLDDAVTATRPRDRRVSPDVEKVADYYASRLDTAGIDARGLGPLSSELAAVAAIADRTALAAQLGRTLRLDDGTNGRTESLWGLWVHQGFHDPYHYAGHLVQGGLGLDDKDDYLDPSGAARRARYLTHIEGVLRSGGFDQPQVRAARVLDLEIAIARSHASRADTDDVFKTDNVWRGADFIDKAPGIDWAAYFASAGLNSATSFVVWQPQAVIGGARLVATEPLDAWKDYLAFHLIEHYAAVLPRASDADLSTPDSGQQAVAATEAALGDAIGRLYVERYFPPRAKAAAIIMVENIRIAFRAHLIGLRWLSPATKSKALTKLAALRIGLGYPETWTDYAQLSVVRGDAFGNLRRAEALAYRREVARLNRRVDPDEWPGQLHPQAVGAILNVSPNSMDFAAGLLQPPYFDADGDAASNYGSAGAGIAHEISHSFDAVGNLYDARGRLGQWWTKDDLSHLAIVSAPLASQLDACCPEPDACAHGQQVLGESVADLGGLAIAHDAYLRSLNGRPDVVKAGLTGEQRFFLAFAQRWRRLQTDAAQHRQIATDTHAPAQCRSDLVRNIDAWAQAYAVKPGDELYLRPEKRVRIW